MLAAYLGFTIAEMANFIAVLIYAYEVGSAVCVQGEPRERFYLVERGTARVVRDGAGVATLVSGDFFGEIALLRDIPRTTTVEAVSDLDLLVLERGPFLDAIESSACKIEAAHLVSQTRMDELGM